MRKVLFTLCFLSLAMWIFGACTPPSDPCTLPEAPDCGANGSCVDNGGVAECDCEPGYDGALCDNNIQDCPETDPCVNGSCEDGIEAYTCACDPGYEGELCDSDIDDCASEPCENDGICTDGVNSYTCDCPPGYDPEDNCADIDDCASDPCENEGICTDGINEFTCECALGYSGLTCDSVDFMKVFVTETLHTANLGGVLGADEICQEEADAAGLVGEFYAWLSTDPSNQPLERFTDPGMFVPYRLPDLTLVAHNLDNLICCPLSNPIGQTADGTVLTQEDVGVEEGFVWTSTDGHGVAVYYDNPLYNCNNFTAVSGGSSAFVGHIYGGPGFWSYSQYLDCWSSARLYCFQQ